jgi:hypothetical protein
MNWSAPTSFGGNTAPTGSRIMAAWLHEPPLKVRSSLPVPASQILRVSSPKQPANRRPPSNENATEMTIFPSCESASYAIPSRRAFRGKNALGANQKRQRSHERSYHSSSMQPLMLVEAAKR